MCVNVQTKVHMCAHTDKFLYDAMLISPVPTVVKPKYTANQKITVCFALVSHTVAILVIHKVSRIPDRGGALLCYTGYL